MPRTPVISIWLVSLVSTSPAFPRETATQPTSTQPTLRYETRSVHDPDGIGKFYMGREIAHVMGHEGADWLERPEREREEAPTLLMKSLDLRPGEVVCDLGAGSGYLTERLAKLVGPAGRVKAVDVQPEMIELLKKRLASVHIDNVDTILGDEKNPHLEPSSVDMVLMVDVYHEFAYPYEMMQHIVRALRPRGRVVLVEYRKEDPKVPIKQVHKMTAQQVNLEMRAAGLVHDHTDEVLPRQHIFIYKRSAPPSQPSSAAESAP